MSFETVESDALCRGVGSIDVECQFSMGEYVLDGSDLDDQNYQGSEDDDFRPSEEIPADQSIPFPTDI